MIRYVLAAAVLTIGLTPICSSSSYLAEEQLEVSGAYELEQALPDETREVLDELGIELTAEGIGEVTYDGVFGTLSQICADTARKPLTACLGALCVTVICAMCAAISEKSDGGLPASFDIIGSAAASAAVCFPVAAFIDSAAEGISSLCGFSAVLVPVLAGLAAVSGHSAAAASGSAFALAAAEAINVVIPTVILPILRIMLGIAAVSSLYPPAGLDRLTGSAEKAAKWLMVLIGTVMSGALGVSSVAAAAADRATSRAARFVLSGAVPVVGGAISDAMGTVTNCVAIVRASAGAYGLVAAAFVVLPAAVSAVLWMLGLSCSAWAAEALGASRPAAAMKAMSSVVSMTLGLIVLVTVLTTCSAAVIMNLRSA